jgi:hypothetical protein
MRVHPAARSAARREVLAQDGAFGLHCGFRKRAFADCFRHRMFPREFAFKYL